MSNIIVDENGMRSTIYDVIELPNKGMIYLDSKAFDMLDGSVWSSDRTKNNWTCDIKFSNNNKIEHAVVDETTKREYR